MGVSRVFVCRRNTTTFSSGSGGRVFLCPRMLKKSASGVLGSSKSSTYRLGFSEGEVLEGFSRSPRSIGWANGPTKCGRYLLRFRFACGLAGQPF
jgi:hypothetical protein